MIGLRPYLTLLFKTRWPMLLLVAAAMAGLVLFTAVSMVNRYTTQELLNDYAAGYEATTGMAALLGRGENINTLGSATANEVAAIALLLFPVLGIVLGVSLTRSIEHEGLLDILSSDRLSPGAPIVAAFLAACVSMAVFCVGTAAGLIAMGYPIGGTISYVIALALLTLSITAFAIVIAQITVAPPEAYGLSLALAMTLYLSRAVVDSREGPSSIWNPQSWLGDATPWANRPTLWPYVAWIVLMVALISTALILRHYRDHGAGIVQPRPGPTSAAQWIHTPVALAIKLALGSVLAWSVGATIFAFAMSSIAEDLATINLTIGIGEKTDRAQLNRLIVLFTQLNALMAMGCGLQRISAIKDEETSGRADWVLSTKQSRNRWWLSSISVGVGSSLIVLIVTGVATATGLLITSSADGLFVDALLATIAYAPAVLVTVAIASFLCAIRPRTLTLAWAFLGWGLYIILRDDLTEYPRILRYASPLEWIRNLPVESWNNAGPAMLLVTSILLVFGSLYVFQRRDLNPH